MKLVGELQRDRSNVQDHLKGHYSCQHRAERPHPQGGPCVPGHRVEYLSNDENESVFQRGYQNGLDENVERQRPLERPRERLEVPPGTHVSTSSSPLRRRLWNRVVGSDASASRSPASTIRPPSRITMSSHLWMVAR